MANANGSLVVYSGLAPFMNDKVVDVVYMKGFPGGEALALMAKAIMAAGYDFMTFDRYLSQHPNRRGLLLSDMASGLTESTGLLPALCMSLESPIIATHYYHNLSALTAPFRKVWDWTGTKSRIANSEARFIPNAWPTTEKQCGSVVPWENRRFLAMVSGNKRALQMGWPRHALKHPRHLLRTTIQNLRTLHVKRTDPWMQSEIYLERLRAIGYFARHSDFDLFGTGWDTVKTKPEQAVRSQVMQTWRGPLPYEEKLRVLGNYKFYLCVENTVFPGYLTEKLFDCFFAGVIPVYLGDPDVEKRIPPTTFIDARRYSSFEELDEYLCSMPRSVAEDYLAAAGQFLASDAFKPFTADHFSNVVVAVMDQVSAECA